jgi:hypothetical protein
MLRIGNGALLKSLSSSDLALAALYLGADAGDHPFGDRIMGVEMLDRLVAPGVDDERVDLHGFAGAHGFAAKWLMRGRPAARSSVLLIGRRSRHRHVR